MLKTSTAVVLAVGLTLSLAACGGDDSTSEATAAASATAAKAEITPPPDLLTPGTLTFGNDPSYPPLSSMKDGEFVGFEPELGKLIAAKLGLDVKFVQIGFDSLIPSLQAKKFDAVLSDLYVTEERAKTVDFIPYNTEGVALITKASSDYAPKVDTDLCGRTVAIVSGSFQIPFMAKDGMTGKKCPADQPITVKTFKTEPQTVQEVTSGRADVATSTNASGAKILADHPEFGLKITDPADVLYESPVGIAVPENADALKEALQAAIDSLDEDGSLPALLDEYGLPPADPELFKQALGGQD